MTFWDLVLASALGSLPFIDHVLTMRRIKRDGERNLREIMEARERCRASWLEDTPGRREALRDFGAFMSAHNPSGLGKDEEVVG